MFDENSLKKIDTKYFNIILMDDRDITIQSRNTGHYWYLHCTEYPMEPSILITSCRRPEHWSILIQQRPMPVQE